AGAQRRVESGAVEAVVVLLGHDELARPRGQIGHDADIGLALEARRRRFAEAARSARSGPAMLGVKETYQDRDGFRIGEFGEDHGEALAAKEIEEDLNLRNDVPGLRNFHRLPTL